MHARGSRLLWSNAVISLAAAFTVAQTLARMHPLDSLTHTEWAFAWGIGAATWCAYTWQRHVKSTRTTGLRPEHRDWHRSAWPTLRNVGLIFLPLAATPVALTLTSIGNGYRPPEAAFPLILVLAMGITLLYAGLPGELGARKALRRIPGIKMLWIGLAWAIITAGWPLWWGSPSPGSNVLMLTVGCERFLTIAALTLPFDLRDRTWDPAEMRTWPQLLGTQGTRVLALAFLLAAAGLRWASSPAATDGVILGLLPMAVAVLLAREKRSPDHYALLDGLLIVDACVFLV